MSDHIEFDFSELTDDELVSLSSHAMLEISRRQSGKSTIPSLNPEYKGARKRRVLQIVPPIKGDADA